MTRLAFLLAVLTAGTGAGRTRKGRDTIEVCHARVDCYPFTVSCGKHRLLVTRTGKRWTVTELKAKP